MARKRPSAWSPAQRLLHWGIAAMVLTAAPLGVYMVALPFQALLLKFLLYQVHKSIGMAALLLGLSQLLLHWRRGRPSWGVAMPGWQRRAAATVHAALFALLLSTPLLGYLTAATAPARIPTLFLGVVPVPHITGTDPDWFAVLRRIHLGAAVLLILLALGHALMALHHHRRGDGTLRRMWRGGPGPSATP